MEHLAAKTLELNAIGVANLSTDKPIVFEPYDTDRRDLGGFLLIDKMTNATVAAGMLHFSLRRAPSVHWRATDIGREHHAAMKNQSPAVLLAHRPVGRGQVHHRQSSSRRSWRAIKPHTFLLDGDNVRHGLNKDLGFTDADRVENIRRIGEVAKLMTDAGLIVITALHLPLPGGARAWCAQMMKPGEFLEIHIDTPLADAEARDVKGLYAQGAGRPAQELHRHRQPL